MKVLDDLVMIFQGFWLSNYVNKGDAEKAGVGGEEVGAGAASRQMENVRWFGIVVSCTNKEDRVVSRTTREDRVDRTTNEAESAERLTEQSQRIDIRVDRVDRKKTNISFLHYRVTLDNVQYVDNRYD
ncbi:hypothetical protein Sjap_019602 [Stephania japonica]|uniref:Uncharacterized protein n=1 Tax=Stephania japonica TaxID=461633 RepID=A0AAP0F4C9_9MAGN